MHFSSTVKLHLYPEASKLWLAVTPLSNTAASLSLIKDRKYSETWERLFVGDIDTSVLFFSFLKRFYLFIFRRGGEEERERMGIEAATYPLGPGPQPRHVP